MPYRVDVANASETAFDVLIELGALDIELEPGGLAALMPDAVPAGVLCAALGGSRIRVSPALGRDDESVWTLRQRPVRVRSLRILPAGEPAGPDTIRLTDSPAFGTGLHATTALCLEAIDDVIEAATPRRMLDVGTGSGILALASLKRGVSRAVGLDLDRVALQTALDNARLNGVADRTLLVRGGPDSVLGSWPLVVANIRAADLMEMAAALVRRVDRSGRLVLSGIPDGVAADVELTYRALGMKPLSLASRDGWSALLLCPSW